MIGFARRLRSVVRSRNSWGLADQALLSATNFVTMILLARVLSPAEFGAFALLYTTLLFNNGFQSTLVTLPHNILGVAKRGWEYRRYTSTTGASQLVLAAATALVGIVATSVSAAVGWSATPLLAALVPAAVAWMTQEFVRRVLYTEGRLAAAVANDAISYGGQLVAVVLVWQAGALSAVTALVTIAVTSAVAVAFGCWQLRHSFARALAWADFRENWHYGKWLAGAFIAYWFSSQLYLYLAAILLGTAATGALKAGLVVMGPLNVLLIFIDTTIPIALARTLGESGEQAMDRQLRRTFALSAPFIGLYCLAVAIFAGPLLHLFYGSRYAGAELVLTLLAVHYFVIYIARTLAAAVRAQRRTKYVFQGHLYAGIAAITVGWVFILVGNVEGAVVGMMLSGLIDATVLLHGYRSGRRPVAQQAAPGWVPAASESVRARLFGAAVDRPLIAAALASVIVAAGVSLGHPILAGTLATLPLVAFALGQGLVFLSRVTVRARMIGLVCLLLLASTFVWRTRTTQALDSNPLDKAALVRIAFVALAALCAFAFLFSPELHPLQMPVSLKLLGAYILTAGLAALTSPLPLQALYRVFELSCGFLAIYVAFVLLGDRAGPLVIRLLMGAIGVIVAVIWLEALLVPTRAWSPTVSVVAPYELQGYLPSYSTNAVGTFGALLAIWGLVRPGTAPRSGYWATAALIGGLATLVAAQYRTGIVGFLAAALVILWYRRRVLLTAILVVLASAAMFVGWSQVSADASRVFSKGRPELVGNLDSRTLYWQAARPLIAERPFFGWGLDVGSRRVLVSLGDNVTSTIHSTWVEAVLGTGFVGASFLALAFLTALGRAWQSRETRLGLAITGMLVFMIVRSITGTTTELFDFGFMVFASLAFSAEVLARSRRPAVAPAVASWRVNEA